MIGILIVTLLFTIIHIQYNWFGLLQVFMIGLLLTWTRWRSGSTLLPMVDARDRQFLRDAAGVRVLPLVRLTLRCAF